MTLRLIQLQDENENSDSGSQERYQLRNSTKEVSQILNPVVLPFI